MTGYKLSEADINEFHEAFTLFDKDGNGLISRCELVGVVRSLGHNPTREEIRQMMEEVDADGDGSIDFNEFLKVMTKKLDDCEPEREMQEAFEVFDKNGDGYISQAELRDAMASFGENVSVKETKKMMEHADIDGDGRVDYDGKTSLKCCLQNIRFSLTFYSFPTIEFVHMLTGK
ncbi:unnamed protein product [Rodentolepis nana]|uniref:Calmodulin n=1 Tax=Rodentolepis nana TaxID=102285 RepID=A0A0R3T4Y4_RODNA|nr:unnamed protein product [Rodentolepis nana]